VRLDVGRNVCVGLLSTETYPTPEPSGPVGYLVSSARSPRESGAIRCPSVAHTWEREVFTFLAELSRGPWPTLVALEDVDWADEATLDLLRFLGRGIAGVRAC
jgi:hypothetical protein